MISIPTIAERAHLPLVAIVLIAGIGLAAASRDLMKRLLGASVALLAAVAHLVAVTGAGPALTGGFVATIVLALAAGALGLVVLVRIREEFGGVDARAVRLGVEDDAARVELER